MSRASVSSRSGVARVERTLSLGDYESAPCTVWNPSGSTRDVLFLSGFGRHPEQYDAPISLVARDLDARVFGPFLYGNGGRRDSPASIEACVRQTRAALRALLEEPPEGGAKLADAGREVHLLGHSTGGLIANAMVDPRECAVRSVVAVNPPVPVSYGPLGFACRGMRITLRHELGRSGDPVESRALQRSSRWRLPRAVLRRPLRHYRLVRDLAALRMTAFGCDPQAGAATPRTTIVGAGDEFFEWSSAAEEALGKQFALHQVVRLTGTRSHEWPLIEPALAASTIGVALLR